MRVIDGIHRLMAASINGQSVIDVEFFDGSSEDAFLRAVEANVQHGLPLTQADRTAAALRILTSHPNMSDRAVARSTGLGARTVAELRRSSDAVPKLNFRVGRDGKVRPLDAAKGRLRVAELIKENPESSLRKVAREAGVSPATALDVRRRLERGEKPVPSQGSAPACETVTSGDRPLPAVTLDKLMRDPSLRQSELGRRLLRMFRENAVGAEDMTDIVASVPLHCIDLAIQLSRQNSRIWEDFTHELKRRAQVLSPE